MRSRRAKKQPAPQTETIVEVKIPEELLNTDDINFKLNKNPEFLDTNEILPNSDAFPADSEFIISLKNSIRDLEGTENAAKRSEMFKNLVAKIVAGTYDTEEKYFWLISCVARLFLQKERTNSLILESEILQKWNSNTFYCPAKLHLIAKEIFQVARGNTFGVALLVSKLNHVNAAFHYLCITLVSAVINKIHTKRDPEVFQPHKPSDLVPILTKSAMPSLSFEEFHQMLKMVSLYNCLVVMNRSLEETHAADLVKILTKGRKSYVEAAKKWLKDASNYVEKLRQKKQFCSWLIDLNQQIVMELQYGLRDAVEEAKVYRDDDL
ncbi:uncharacterized protein LOC134831400 [Culicoides brevitarsis]|uniref:uncharacterized protein LOC134831400 n=1 Tax=Culicoides brevitarsis TaxID=469753 RepID=UPI00307CC538